MCICKAYAYVYLNFWLRSKMRDLTCGSPSFTASPRRRALPNFQSTQFRKNDALIVANAWFPIRNGYLRNIGNGNFFRDIYKSVVGAS